MLWIRNRLSAALILAMAAVNAHHSCWSDDKEAANVEWYARPTSPDDDTLQLLDDFGANAVAYRFRLPPDTKLVVVLLAKDEKGERIESLTKIYKLTPDEAGQPWETTFRLVHIDPSQLLENYDGKARWVIHAGKRTQQAWEPNRYRATGTYASWWQGLNVESPEIAKDYFLWKVVAHPAELRDIFPDSPTTFSIQLRFRYERIAGYPYGAAGEGGDYDREFARDVPDPRTRSRRED